MRTCLLINALLYLFYFVGCSGESESYNGPIGIFYGTYELQDIDGDSLCSDILDTSISVKTVDSIKYLTSETGDFDDIEAIREDGQFYFDLVIDTENADGEEISIDLQCTSDIQELIYLNIDCGDRSTTCSFQYIRSDQIM